MRPKCTMCNALNITKSSLLRLMNEGTSCWRRALLVLIESCNCICLDASYWYKEIQIAACEFPLCKASQEWRIMSSFTFNCQFHYGCHEFRFSIMKVVYLKAHKSLEQLFEGVLKCIFHCLCLCICLLLVTS